MQDTKGKGAEVTLMPRTTPRKGRKTAEPQSAPPIPTPREVRDRLRGRLPLVDAAYLEALRNAFAHDERRREVPARVAECSKHMVRVRIKKSGKVFSGLRRCRAVPWCQICTEEENEDSLRYYVRKILSIHQARLPHAEVMDRLEEIRNVVENAIREGGDSDQVWSLSATGAIPLPPVPEKPAFARLTVRLPLGLRLWAKADPHILLDIMGAVRDAIGATYPERGRGGKPASRAAWERLGALGFIHTHKPNDPQWWPWIDVILLPYRLNRSAMAHEGTVGAAREVLEPLDLSVLTLHTFQQSVHHHLANRLAKRRPTKGRTEWRDVFARLQRAEDDANIPEEYRLELRWSKAPSGELKIVDEGAATLREVLDADFALAWARGRPHLSGIMQQYAQHRDRLRGLETRHAWGYLSRRSYSATCALLGSIEVERRGQLNREVVATEKDRGDGNFEFVPHRRLQLQLSLETRELEEASAEATRDAGQPKKKPRGVIPSGRESEPTPRRASKGRQRGRERKAGESEHHGQASKRGQKERRS